jgi:hypothetical protein
MFSIIIRGHLIVTGVTKPRAGRPVPHGLHLALPKFRAASFVRGTTMVPPPPCGRAAECRARVALAGRGAAHAADRADGEGQAAVGELRLPAARERAQDAAALSGPALGVLATLAFSTVNLFCMVFLYGGARA